MSFFTDLTLSKYAAGLTNANVAKQPFQWAGPRSYVEDRAYIPYPYPQQWRVNVEWSVPNETAYANIGISNPAPTLPAVDSIHGRRSIAISGSTVPLDPMQTLKYYAVQDMYAHLSGYEICFYLLEMPDSISIPGPGYIVSGDDGSNFVLQARMRAESGIQYWHAYKVTMSEADIVGWQEDVPELGFYPDTPASTTTISNISAFSSSLFGIDISSMFSDTSKCLSVICYNKTETISAHMPGGLEFPKAPSLDYYIQIIVPTKYTVHAYPTWLNEYSIPADSRTVCAPALTQAYPSDLISGLGDQVVHQSSMSYRNICGEANGLVILADDSDKLRMVTLSGNVWIDGVTFDGCGVYVDANPATTIAAGISNCVFSESDIAIRTTFLPGSGSIDSYERGQEQFILQNLFLNCTRAFSDDMVQSYVATSATKSDETKSWRSRRVIGMNTFEGGEYHLEIERQPVTVANIDIFCNVFKGASKGTAAIVSTEFQSYGNLSDDTALESWIGYDNRCNVDIEYCENTGSGYRPSISAWYKYEMAALYIPHDCCMSYDITGVRHPFFGRRAGTQQFAKKANVWAHNTPGNAESEYWNGYYYSVPLRSYTAQEYATIPDLTCSVPPCESGEITIKFMVGEYPFDPSLATMKTDGVSFKILVNDVLVDTLYYAWTDLISGVWNTAKVSGYSGGSVRVKAVCNSSENNWQYIELWEMYPANANVDPNGDLWSETYDQFSGWKKIWAPYSNCAKGCFNPVLPSHSSQLFYSVGLSSDNLFKTQSEWWSGMAAMAGCFGWLHVPTGILRIQNASGDVGCGDVLTGVYYSNQARHPLPAPWDSNLELSLMCSGVICPGAYIVKNADGTTFTSDFGDTNMVPVVIQTAKRKYQTLQAAIDDLYSLYPDLSALGKVVSLICYDDIVVNSSHSEDVDSGNGCVTIPAGWTSSATGRLAIIASNSGQLSSKKQSFVDNPGRGFALRYDGEAEAVLNIGAGTDYVHVKGLRIIGEAIRGADEPISYIGISVGSTVTRFMADSNEFLNCTTGITQ